MLKPPQDTKYFHKCDSPKGMYFTICDTRGCVFATSRLFRNQAWYAIGCELLRGVLNAGQGVVSEVERQSDNGLRGFIGILIKPVSDSGEYQFEYITNSGRTLLTSVKFQSFYEAEKAVERFRAIVREIVGRRAPNAFGQPE